MRARRRHVRAFDYDMGVIGSGFGGSAQVALAQTDPPFME
jgi:hypothetical protein